MKILPMVNPVLVPSGRNGRKKRQRQESSSESGNSNKEGESRKKQKRKEVDEGTVYIVWS